jgi:DNA-binding PadR family transcriptional regulator
MNITKLTILGILEQCGAASGYDIIQEIDNRHITHWTDIKSGALYHSISTLHKDGYINEVEKIKEGSRPEKTVYDVTEKGKIFFDEMQAESFMGLFPHFYGFNLALCCNERKTPEEIKESAAKALQRIDEILGFLTIDHYNFEHLPAGCDLKHFKKRIQHHFNQQIYHYQAEKKWLEEVIKNSDDFDNNKIHGNSCCVKGGK